MKRIMNLADRHARALGLLLAAVLAALTAVLNVSRGPLSNLNDIGGWTNRMAFIALAAAAHAAVLAMQALLNRKGFGRLALRQVLTTLGFLLLTLPINQKTLLFTEQVLPLVRKMDAMGLAAANESALNLSAPALTLLYAVTRGPIYDMYSIKLLCVVCNLGLAILAAHAADRRNWGVRAEVLLTLCLILPQGFLAVGCAGQMDIVSAFLLCAALTLWGLVLLLGVHPVWGCMLWGLAAATKLQAAFLFPLLLVFFMKGKVSIRHLLAGLAAFVLMQAAFLMDGQGLAAVFGRYAQQINEMAYEGAGLADHAAGVYSLMTVASVREFSGMGMYLGFACALLVAFALIHAHADVDADTLLLAGLLLAAGLPLILPQMNARCLYLAGMLAFACAGSARRLAIAGVLELISLCSYMEAIFNCTIIPMNVLSLMAIACATVILLELLDKLGIKGALSRESNA